MYITNLLAAAAVTLVTNWTGHNVGTNELGYVTTNHTLKTTYHGIAYSFPLTNELSNIAVWRPAQNYFYATNFTVTNIIWPSPGDIRIHLPTNVWYWQGREVESKNWITE